MPAAKAAPRLHQPAAPADATAAKHRDAWSQGAHKVNETAERSGLDRNELYALMDAGVLVWMHKNAKRTRIIAWASVVDHLARQYEHWLRENPEYAPADLDRE